MEGQTKPTKIFRIAGDPTEIRNENLHYIEGGGV
jgi:hypothetical protein